MVNALRSGGIDPATRWTTSTPTARRRRWAMSPKRSRSSAASATTRLRIAVSSTKSMTGHLLGAAGGIEAVFTALAIQRIRSLRRPSTSSTRIRSATWTTLPNQAREMKIRVALSNSFGFGGTNGGTLAFGRFHAG